MDAISRGSDQELAELLLAHAEPLRRYIQDKMPKRHRGLVCVEDILQEVWIAASRAAVAEIRNPQRWLITLANSKIVDAIRLVQARKRGGGRVLPDAVNRRSSWDVLFERVHRQTPSREVAAQEARHAVQVALATLPPPRQQVIRLRYIEGLSHQEIAQVLGKSTSSINSLLFRGLRELHARLGRAARYFSDTRSSDQGQMTGAPVRDLESGP